MTSSLSLSRRRNATNNIAKKREGITLFEFSILVDCIYEYSKLMKRDRVE